MLTEKSYRESFLEDFGLQKGYDINLRLLAEITKN